MILTDTEIQALRNAREFLGVGPERWLRGQTFGYDPTLGNCEPVAACSDGALIVGLQRAGERDHINRSYVVLRRVLDATLGYISLVKWNDLPGRTYAEVLDLFDRTIAVAEAERILADAPEPVHA